tara:strand:- start:4089 stop:5981 length:1893 start_codon:yes stop_codon:yes gene_type:complete
MSSPSIELSPLIQGTNQLDKTGYGLGFPAYNLTGLCNADLLSNEDGETGGFSIGSDGQDFEIILTQRTNGHGEVELDLNNVHIKECFSSLGTLEFTLPSLVIGQSNFGIYIDLNNLQVKTRAPERKMEIDEEGNETIIENENPGSIDAIICNPETNLTIIQRPGIGYTYTPPEEEWPPELDPETDIYSVSGQLISRFRMNEITTYATTLKGDILTTISVDEINTNHFVANEISGSIREIVNTGIDRPLENGIRDERGSYATTVYTENVSKRAVFYYSYLDINNCHLNTTWWHDDDGYNSRGNALVFRSVLNGGHIIGNHVDIAESNVENLSFVSGNSIAFEGFVGTKNDNNIGSHWFLSTVKKSFDPPGVVNSVPPEYNLFYSKFAGQYNVTFDMTVRHCNGFLAEAIVKGRDVDIHEQENLYQSVISRTLNTITTADNEKIRHYYGNPSTLFIYDLFGVCNELPKTENIHGILLEGEVYGSENNPYPFNIKQDIDQFVNVTINGLTDYSPNGELFATQSPQVAMIDPGSTITAKNIFLSKVRNYGTIICTGVFKPNLVANFGTIKMKEFSGPGAMSDALPGEGTTAERLDASFGLANHPLGIVQIIDAEGNVIEDISNQLPRNLLFKNT